jgi:hypothetical protein
MVGQVLKLAGSMAAIGSPVDLASNVGSGVRELFYEPMQVAAISVNLSPKVPFMLPVNISSYAVIFLLFLKIYFYY